MFASIQMTTVPTMVLICLMLIGVGANAAAFAQTLYRHRKQRDKDSDAQRSKINIFKVTLPLVGTVVFLAMLVATAVGYPPELPESIKAAINSVMTPASVLIFGTLSLLAAYIFRRYWVVPPIPILLLDLILVLFCLSLRDPYFAATVGREDNVAIVGLVFLFLIFGWVAIAQGVANDQRIARTADPGRGREGRPIEASIRNKAYAWPDLVYIELIASLAICAVLIVWSLLMPAPLLHPADPSITPNPAKAPWYFLGLQELLLFFDPWYAGVAIPCLIIFGLAAIPYLDNNKEGSGYYTIDRRRFAIIVFNLGLGLWLLLIIVGTIFRGPNWSFFGPYEHPDPHRTETVVGSSLSSYVWGQSTETATATAPTLASNKHPLVRELPGLALLAAYFIGVPILLGRTIMRARKQQMRAGRFYLMMFLLMSMATVPIKMFGYWIFHLRYIIYFPEIGLNL